MKRRLQLLPATVVPIRPIVTPTATQARDEAALEYAAALSRAEQARDLEREVEQVTERMRRDARCVREKAEASVTTCFERLHRAAQSVRPETADEQSDG